MTEAVNPFDLPKWFGGLSGDDRKRWLDTVDRGNEVPPELLDTLPADRRPGEPGQRVVLIGAYWPHGLPAGQRAVVKPKMTTELEDFLQHELDRHRESPG